MTENLKKFLEEASKNEELKAKLTALTDKETAMAKAVELAKEYGFTLTAEDFQPADGAELSLDELDNVAGGSDDDCQCVICSTGNNYPGIGDDGCRCLTFGTGK